MSKETMMETTNSEPKYPDGKVSTIESIRERILSMPEDQDFAILIEIGGNANGSNGN